MKNLVVEPMACPQSAMLTITREELKEVCDQAWEKNGQFLIKKFDTKFAKSEGGDQPKAREYLEKNIGYSALYAQDLSNFVVTLAQKELGKNILSLQSIPRITESPNPEEVNIYFVFFFTPMINYDGNFDNISLPYVPEFTLETMINNQIEAMRKQPFTGCLNLNCRFTLEIEASTGKKDKTEYQSLNEIDFLALREILTTHKTGDEFPYSFDEGGEMKEFSVKISDVYYRDDAVFDDDFAKTYGFENVEDMNKKSAERYTSMQDNRKGNMAVDHIINEIATKGKVDPIPVEFVQHHVNRIKEENYNTHGKKTTWEKFGVQSDQEFSERLDNAIVQDFMQTMAFRCYAKICGLETTDIQELAKHMMTKVNWV